MCGQSSFISCQCCHLFATWWEIRRTYMYMCRLDRQNTRQNKLAFVSVATFLVKILACPPTTGAKILFFTDWNQECSETSSCDLTWIKCNCCAWWSFKLEIPRTFPIDIPTIIEIIWARYTNPNWQRMFCKYRAFLKLCWNITRLQISAIMVLFSHAWYLM